MLFNENNIENTKNLIKSFNEDEKKILTIEWSFNNPDNWSEAETIEAELIIKEEEDGTFSWKETHDDAHAEGFESAGEAYENAVENESNVEGAYGLSDYDGFQIDMDYNEVVAFFGEEDELDLTDEARAVAKYLDIPATDVEDVENGNEVYGDYLYKVEAKKDGKKLTFLVSGNTANIQMAAEEAMEDLFDTLTVPEFCEKVIPHLSGNIDDYLSLSDLEEGDSLEQQIEDGVFNGVFGSDFRGFVDVTKLAEDMISQYGAGHELASYDGKTQEQEFDGVTYYIFKQDEEDLNENLKESEEKVFAQMDKDTSDIQIACSSVYYGFYEAQGKDMTPNQLVEYFENEIAKENEFSNYAKKKYPEALQIVKRWIKKNA